MEKISKEFSIRLRANNHQVFVNPLDINQDEVIICDQVNLMETSKLKIESGGEWNLTMGVFKWTSPYLESRNTFDDWVHPREMRTNEELFTKLTIEEALDKFWIEISIDMNYYLNNRSELESDLNWRIDWERCSEMVKSKIEKGLFYKQMVNIFGKDYDYHPRMGYKFDLQDFHILANAENSKIATAKRGDYFLTFEYSTF